MFWIDPNDNTKGKVCLAIDASSTKNWGDAVAYCNNLTENGYDDWYLPSKDELNLMCVNLKDKGLGGFSDNTYWSATEYDDTDAWKQNFYSGYQFYNSKFYPISVRAVGAF